MNVTAKTRNRRKEAKDEVQVQAMAGHGIVPDVDSDNVPVVTMEHVAAASSAIKGIPLLSPSDDTSHVRVVIIGTGTMQLMMHSLARRLAGPAVEFNNGGH